EPTTVWSSPCVRICVGAQIISNWRAVTSKLSAFCSQLMLAIAGSWPGPRPQTGSPWEMVRDLMIDCVERRFAGTKVPHPIEWLSDNGSAYIARDTLDTATALGLRLCFTPVRSPESNGICEAFVKALKRDYARLSILPNSQTVFALLPSWFEDYNEVHPHSGLKFRSPREFLRMSA